MSDKSKSTTEITPTDATAEPETPQTVSGRAALILDRLEANPFAAGSDTIRELVGLVADLAAVVEAQPTKET